MPKSMVSLRLEPGLRETAEQHGRELGLHSFTECVEAALEHWAGSGDAAARKAAERAAEAEAEAEHLRDELIRLRARVAGVAAVPAGPSPADRFIAALASATEEVPVTRGHLIRLSRLDSYTVDARLSWLRGHGYVFQPKGPNGPYAPVPGMDVREGVEAAQAANAAAKREQRGSSPRKPGPPVPAPRHVRPLPARSVKSLEPGTPRGGQR